MPAGSPLLCYEKSVLPRDEFKERLSLVISIAAQKAEKRRMSLFRKAYRIQEALQSFLTEMKDQGLLECPWLDSPPRVSELIGLLGVRHDDESIYLDVGLLLNRIYPPEQAHRFPIAAGKAKPKPPSGPGRFVDVDG